MTYAIIPNQTTYDQSAIFCEQSVFAAQSDVADAKNIQIDIDDVLSYILQQDFVIGARGFECENGIVIALITSPFYLKSQRDRARIELQNKICEMTDRDDVIVTFSTEVYRKIRNELNDKQMQALLALAKEY